MKLDSFLQSFKRQEIASYSAHMTRMTLTIIQRYRGKCLLVVEGAEHTDEDGNVSTEPLMIGEVSNRSRLRAVARALSNNISDIGMSGDYNWTAVGATSDPLERHLWSIAWTNSNSDPGSNLPEFLCLLGDRQIETIVRMFSDPNSPDLIALARAATGADLYGKRAISIRRCFDSCALEDGSVDIGELTDKYLRM